MDRRTWLQLLSILSAARIGYSQSPVPQPPASGGPPAGGGGGGRGQQLPMRITKEQMQGALKVIGLEFQDSELDLMLPRVNRAISGYEAVRKIEVPYDTEAAIVFLPCL